MNCDDFYERLAGIADVESWRIEYANWLRRYEPLCGLYEFIVRRGNTWTVLTRSDLDVADTK